MQFAHVYEKEIRQLKAETAATKAEIEKLQKERAEMEAKWKANPGRCVECGKKLDTPHSHK